MNTYITAQTPKIGLFSERNAKIYEETRPTVSNSNILPSSSSSSFITNIRRERDLLLTIILYIQVHEQQYYYGKGKVNYYYVHI